MSVRRPRGRPRHDDVLTPGEWRIVEAVRHGMTTRAVAERRAISVDAVKYHLANALQKLGLSGRAQLRRWDGVAKGSLLHSTEVCMSEQMGIGPIGQISRTVTDIGAASAWYRDVLGLSHLYTFGTLAFFDCGGTRLFLSQGKAATESILYFRVPDIRAAHAALSARGATFVNAPHLVHRHADGTEEWMAMFEDNDSRVLAIMSQVRAA